MGLEPIAEAGDGRKIFRDGPENLIVGGFAVDAADVAAASIGLPPGECLVRIPRALWLAAAAADVPAPGTEPDVPGTPGEVPAPAD